MHMKNWTGQGASSSRSSTCAVAPTRTPRVQLAEFALKTVALTVFMVGWELGRTVPFITKAGYIRDDKTVFVMTCSNMHVHCIGRFAKNAQCKNYSIMTVLSKNI